MEFTFTVAGAMDATEAGLVREWVQAYLKVPEWKNRALAGILHGQQPTWEGPVEIEISSLLRIAGPGPEFRYPKAPEIWNREVRAIAGNLTDPLLVPPVIARQQPDGRHLSDGNHRVDALSSLGYGKVWALIWHDANSANTGVWHAFGPGPAPVVAIAEGEAYERAVEFALRHTGISMSDPEDILISAEIEGTPIGVLSLRRSGIRWMVQSMFVRPECRNRFLGHRMLRVLATVEAPVIAYPAERHTRLFRDAGFELGDGGEVVLHRG